MKIVYTGSLQELSPAQLSKIERKFGKLGRLLDKKGEREAHVILTTERHLRQAEITVRYYDHPLVGIGSSEDLFSAILVAMDKLEKQALKMSAKWREARRSPRVGPPAVVSAEAASPSAPLEPAETEDAPSRVFRVDEHDSQKPMTLEEALLAMELDRDYVAYRDTQTDRVSILLRRRDGHFDLIEG